MMTVRKRDLVDLVEAFYSPVGELDRWAATLCEHAAPLLDHGLGVVSRLDRLDPPEAMGLHVQCDDADFAGAVERTHRATQHDALRMYAPNQGLSRLSELVGMPLIEAFPDTGSDSLIAKGANDWVTLSAADGTGYLVTIAAAMPGELEVQGSNNLWLMVSAHLSAAFRLHRQRQDLLGSLDDSAIVDTVTDRVVHADGRAKPSAALEQIRAAVRAIDRARAQRADPELALSVWEGLVDGTWSVVDRHDHDGRRFIVAVPNEPHLLDPRGLSDREAQVAALAAHGFSDKMIGYSLGLGRSTVATHLAQAIRKLGIRDRVELATVFGVVA